MGRSRPITITKTPSHHPFLFPPCWWRQRKGTKEEETPMAALAICNGRCNRCCPSRRRNQEGTRTQGCCYISRRSSQETTTGPFLFLSFTDAVRRDYRTSQDIPLTKADLSYQFTFTCPTAPSWPLQKPAAAFTGEKQSRRCTSLTKRCCVGVTEEVEEHQVEAAFGRRLLARRSPAERATLRRRSLWRSQNRAVSL